MLETNMPIQVRDENDIKAGEIYEDSYFHPCLCTSVVEGEVRGISLVDGTYPRCEDATMVRKLTIDEAFQWKLYGPEDEDLGAEFRWWDK